MQIIDRKKPMTFLRNPYCFLIFITIDMLLATVVYTVPIYNFLLYFVILWGIFLIIDDILFQKLYCQTKEYIFFAIFLAFNVITILLSLDQNMVTNSITMIFSAIYFYIYLSIDIRYSSNKTQKQLVFVCSLIIIFTLLVSVVSLLLVVTGTHFSYFLDGVEYLLGFRWREVVGFGRVFMMTGLRQNSILAISATISIICSLVLLCFRNKTYKIPLLSKKSVKVLLIANIILQYICIALSDSLTVFFSMLAASVVVAFFYSYSFGERYIARVFNKFLKNKESINRFVLVLCSCMIAIVLVIATLAVVKGGQTLLFYTVAQLQREQSVENGISDGDKAGRDPVISLGTATGRYEIWKEAFNLWKEKPIFGWGNKNVSITAHFAQTSVIYTNLHNGFISVLVSNGLAGFIIIMAWLCTFVLRTLRFLFKPHEDNKITILLFGGVVFLCVLNLAQEAFILQRGITTIVLIAFMKYLRYYIEKNSMNTG